MLPASTSAAKAAATPSEQTPSGPLKQTPALTNPASTDEANAPTLLPASLPAQPVSSTPAAQQSRQSEAVLLPGMPAAMAEPLHNPTGHDATNQEAVSTDATGRTADMASAAISHDLALDHVKDQAVVPAEATDNAGDTAQGMQAHAQHAGQTAEDVQGSTVQAEGGIRQDSNSLHQPDDSTQDLQARQNCLTTEPEAAVRVAISDAASSPQAAGDANNLISDSESEDLLGTTNPASTGSISRGSVSSTGIKQDAAAASPEAQAVSASPLQQATQPPDNLKEDASLPPSSNSQVMLEGGSCQAERALEPSVLQQSSTIQPPVPLLHSTVDPLCSSGSLSLAVEAAPLPSSAPSLPEAGAMAAPHSSAGQRQQQPTTAGDGSPASTVVPVHGSSESLLHAEAEAAHLAMLLAPSVYRPPALAQQLEALGKGVQAQHSNESPVQMLPKVLPDAALSTSIVVTAETPADVMGTAAVSRQVELSDREQPPKVPGDEPVLKADSKNGRQGKEDVAEQEGAKTKTSNGLQQLAVQVARNRLPHPGTSELARPWPASGLEQERTLPQLQDAADLVIPDR